jgi:enoyl-CoA hydratase
MISSRSDLAISELRGAHVMLAAPRTEERPLIETTRVGAVTVLRLAHGKANALDLELLAALDGALRDLESAPGAVVITGSGSIFSAGVDLHRLLAGGAAYLDRFLPALTAACERLLAFPRPLVAAVNGHALAGGWIFACAADYRVVAAGRAKLGVPELQVGVPFPPAALETLRLHTPPHLLDRMIFACRTFTVDEAAALGLVEEVVDGEALADRALAVAAAMAAIPTESYRLTKLQVRAPALERSRAGGAVDAQVAARWRAPETLEVIRGYLARVVGKGGG